MEFLEENIITRFGFLSKITTENAKKFSSSEITSFYFKYGFILSHSSNYYPHGNCLVESSNKKLMTILKRIIGSNKKYWDRKIKYALSGDRITRKRETRKNPFQLVYGSTSSLPIYLQFPVYEMLQEHGLEEDSMPNRINYLIELDEIQSNSLGKSMRNQEN